MTKLYWYFFSILFLMVLPIVSEADLSPKRNIFMPVSSAAFDSASDFKTRTFTIYYADLDDIYKLLSDRRYQFLSKIGTVSIHKQLRQIWLKDDIQHLTAVEKVIQRLDVPYKQVLIKARIVNIDTQSLDALGFYFSTFAHTKNNSVRVNSTDEDALGAAFPLVKLKVNNVIDFQLSALEKIGQAQILARPELTTLDRQTAIIQSGEEVPYVDETRHGGQKITFKKAALQLEVTPKVLPHNKILLKLKVNQDKISPVNVAGTPAIHTQTIQTQVLVSNRQTIALGGIFEQTSDQVNRRVPFIAKLPLIGLLFRHHLEKRERKELMVFVTPSLL